MVTVTYPYFKLTLAIYTGENYVNAFCDYIPPKLDSPVWYAELYIDRQQPPACMKVLHNDIIVPIS